MTRRYLFLFVLVVYSVSAAPAQDQPNCENSVWLAKQLVPRGLHEEHASAKEYTPSGDPYCHVKITVVETSATTDDGRCAMNLKWYYFGDSGDGPELTLPPSRGKALSLQSRPCSEDVHLGDFVMAGLGISFRTMSMVIGAIEHLRAEQGTLEKKRLEAVYSIDSRLFALLCDDERNCAAVFLRLDDHGGILSFELAEVM